MSDEKEVLYRAALRDEIAKEMLIALAVRSVELGTHPTEQAAVAYLFADAMLQARLA